jgi:hypothetical protein
MDHDVDDVAGRARAMILLRAGWGDDAILAQLTTNFGLSEDDSAEELRAAKRFIAVFERVIRRDTRPYE